MSKFAKILILLSESINVFVYAINEGEYNLLVLGLEGWMMPSRFRSQYRLFRLVGTYRAWTKAPGPLARISSPEAERFSPFLNHAVSQGSNLTAWRH
jgi:hypothetical protein